MKKSIFLFVAALLPFFQAYSKWNPDAGYIPPFTAKAVVEASSSPTTALKVIDGDDQTAWQSDAPFPFGFVKNPQLNLLLSRSLLSKFGLTSNGNAVDGDLRTNVTIQPVAGKATAEFSFDTVTLKRVYLKCSVDDTVFVFAVDANGNEFQIIAYPPDENYNWKGYSAEIKDAVKIKLLSKAKFNVFEIAAVARSPKEFVIVDLGKIQKVGWIETRHWAGGNALETKMYSSMDKQNWTELAALNPEALKPVTTRLDSAIPMRFIKVEHTLNDKEYAKVFVWEISAYDQYGPFGKMPEPKPNPLTMAQMIGINGIWGWGYDKCSDELEPGQGPTKFNQFASHARDFHNMHWDVKDPDHVPDFLTMSLGKGTEALPWINWNREYTAWKEAGMDVEVSLKFNQKTLPDTIWETPYKDGYHYGFMFAQHFGPTYGNGLVDVLEVGNEPWDYQAPFYKEVLSGMVNGAKDADPLLKVVPCALQAGFPGEETKKGGNYVGARLTEEVANKVDALNVHHYSYAYNEGGKRVGVQPEHPESSVRGIFNDIRFRDANMPGKPIYLTEWGWDSDGAGEECKHSECVSEKAQALYAVRGALMFARLGIQKMLWFFYGNGGGNIYGRSGLLGSPKANFAEKKSFRAFVSLVKILGNYRFLDVLKEDDEAWVYTLGNADGKLAYIVAWKPVPGDSGLSSKITLEGNYPVESVLKINGDSSAGTLDNSLAAFKEGKLELTVSATPIAVRMAR